MKERLYLKRQLQIVPSKITTNGWLDYNLPNSLPKFCNFDRFQYAFLPQSKSISNKSISEASIFAFIVVAQIYLLCTVSPFVGRASILSPNKHTLWCICCAPISVTSLHACGTGELKHWIHSPDQGSNLSSKLCKEWICWQCSLVTIGYWFKPWPIGLFWIMTCHRLCTVIILMSGSWQRKCEPVDLTMVKI